MRTSKAILTLALVALLPMAGCGGKSDDAAQPAAGEPVSDSLVTRGVQAAITRAAEKLDTENITVGGKHETGFRWGDSTEHLPRAEITPQGDLLIEGRKVAVDAEQRRLLLAHRAELVDVAKAAMSIGVRGADLGVQAASGALKAVFTGTTDEFGQRMEAEGQRIEQQAQQLVCARLPGLRQSQVALAAALPEFRPYATLSREDVENCGKEGQSGGFEASAGDLTAGAGSSHAAEPDAAAQADAAGRGDGSRQ